MQNFMKPFHTLDLAIQFYQAVRTQKLPRHLQDQLVRAASSIAMNLAEGNPKSSPKDKRRFFEIALGSLRECQVILQLERVANPELLDLADHLGGCLYKLTRP